MSQFDRLIRTEVVPWAFVPRHTRKGYMTRDFNVGGRWYAHFANGADERGIIRYGFPKETQA